MGLVFYSLNIEFGILNYVVAFYNLLPINGMDGGTLIKIILGLALENNRVEAIMKIINVIMILIAVTILILACVRGYKVYTLIIFCISLSVPIFLKNC